MASDEELLARIRVGAEDAFETLYGRYEQRLFGFICRRLGNRQDAEEVLQEAMLAIIKHKDIEFSSDGFAPWIYKISLHLCLNRLRRKTIVVTGHEVDARVSPADAPDVVLLNQERHLNISRAVGKLPSALSKLYQMWADGQSYEEMAQLTELPLGTVKSRIHSAITKLRREIK